ncbi:MAG: VCBS repeat-containing protein, partial [Planctomycetota bacterium]|nr:VCBS repeat-containing protein [Planctomycetota bacterium]
IMGGGVALADLDSDGDLDIYLVQGGTALQSKPGDAQGNRLFLNQGNGSFIEAPGANGADDRGYGMGAAAADYDGDGDTDIYVTNVGANVLYRNDGKGTFSDVSGAAGVDEAGWGTAASFADLDNDGDLDLVVVNYIAWSVTVEKRCLAKGPCTYAIPSYFDAPAADHIFRNNGDGTFT